MRLNLTPDQKRIALVLIDAYPMSVRLVHQDNLHRYPIRERTTGAALVRKGMVTLSPRGVARATSGLLELADILRADDAAGRIPPRRIPATQ